MIVLVEGEILSKQQDSVVILCAQLGYEVKAAPRLIQNLPAVGDTVRLHTYLLVREDEHSLYGFNSAQERELFVQLMRVSGIGPRLALTMLAAQEPDSLVLAIRSQDSKALSSIPGIGKKTAERLLLELTDRLQSWSYTSEVSSDNQAMRDAEQALLNLGFSSKEIHALFQQTPQADQLSTEQLVRLALQGQSE